MRPVSTWGHIRGQRQISNQNLQWQEGKVDICPTAAHWDPGLVMWLSQLQGRRPAPPPRAAGEGGPCSGCGATQRAAVGRLSRHPHTYPCVCGNLIYAVVTLESPGSS